MKTLFTIIITISVATLTAQQTGNGNPISNNNQSVNNMDYQVQTNASNINLYAESNVAQTQQQMIYPQQAYALNNNIEPSLDNGFHIRFQLNLPSINEFAYKSSQNNYSSARKIKTTFAKRNFIRKRRFKKLFSYTKKNYKTSLCGRF